jgi:hypothetical protein
MKRRVHASEYEVAAVRGDGFVVPWGVAIAGAGYDMNALQAPTFAGMDTLYNVVARCGACRTS